MKERECGDYFIHFVRILHAKDLKQWLASHYIEDDLLIMIELFNFLEDGSSNQNSNMLDDCSLCCTRDHVTRRREHGEKQMFGKLKVAMIT